MLFKLQKHGAESLGEAPQWLFPVITALFLAVFCAATSAAQGDLLIRNVTILSPERNEPIYDTDVLIQSGYIHEIGKRLENKTEANTLDARGLFLTPGLIDSHVHLYHATGLKRRYAENFDVLYDAYAKQAPRSFLYFGYTSVIELNEEPDTNKIFNSAPMHPRLFSCGHGLVLDDGFMALEFENDSFAKRFPHYLHVQGANHATPDGDDPTNHTVQKSIASLVDNGAICIKLYYEEALWYPGGAPDFRLPSQELIEEVVNEAHLKGVPVLLHATTPAGHNIALSAGIDVMAHGLWEWPNIGYDIEQAPATIIRLTDEAAAANLQLQPTMRTIRNTQSMFDAEFLASPLLKYVLPAEYLDYLNGPGQAQRDTFLSMFGPLIEPHAHPDTVGERLETFNTRYESLIKRFSDKGGRLLLGTDTAVGGFGWGSPPGLSGYLEMQSWERAGISLKTIFNAATIDNAKAFGLEDQLGTIEAGKKADLLLFSENPLVDISAYNTIKTVIVNGQAIDRAELSAVKPLTLDASKY
ncbi:hypothetical protein BOO92_19940 [Vibrio navarrensis]|uniref:amidohydrolase family protein n=1 Tax=Vibrio navarrensis TaxID=29495 RepID=UPI001867AE24|nr:amidohydrolase family protein [Vibrio navarrensis]MBE3658943.1 hypothetical protein [Vibrio navarrensis]